MKVNIVSVIGFVLLSTFNAFSAGEQDENASDVNPHLAESLAEVVESTPITLLFEYKKLGVELLPDEDASDDFAEEKHSYCGNVLEVFNGPQIATLCYFVITEKGETPILPVIPMILSLCENDEGYYWPGVGTLFPYSSKTLLAARSAGEKVRSKEKNATSKKYALCE